MKLSKLIAVTVSALVLAVGVVSPVHAGFGLPSAPEIDPGSMAGALALLSGGLLMITDRLGRK